MKKTITTHDDNLFAKRFAILKKRSGLSNASLSKKLAFKSKGSISAFTSGRGVPSYYSLIAIADYFGVSLDFLT